MSRPKGTWYYGTYEIVLLSLGLAGGKTLYLDYPQLVWEFQRTGNLRTNQHERETMGSPKGGDPHGDRVPVVAKCPG